MSEKDPYEGYRNLLRHWENRCILCGEKFDNMESITREHLVPRSKGGCGKDNYAPSHFNCNQLRGDLSLIEIITILNKRKEQMGKKAFQVWCNKSVPDRKRNWRKAEIRKAYGSKIGDSAVSGIVISID